MKVSVAKVRAIANDINDLLSSMHPHRFARSLSNKDKGEYFIFDDLQDAYASGEEKVGRELDRAEALVLCQYKLRLIVDRSNQNTDVAANLNKKAEQEALMCHFKRIHQQAAQPTFEPTNNKYAAGCSEDFLADIQHKVMQCKKAIRTLDEKNTVLNTTREVELGQDVVDILQEHKLLD